MNKTLRDYMEIEQKNNSIESQIKEIELKIKDLPTLDRMSMEQKDEMIGYLQKIRKILAH